MDSFDSNKDKHRNMTDKRPLQRSVLHALSTPVAAACNSTIRGPPPTAHHPRAVGLVDEIPAKTPANETGLARLEWRSAHPMRWID